MKVLLAAMAWGGQAAKACDAPVDFEIPVQSVEAALLEFALQARMPVLFPSGSYADVNANPVSGSYCPEEALDLLLRGTLIDASIDPSGQLVVRSLRGEEEAVAANADQEDDGLELEESGGSGNSLLSALAAIFARDAEAQPPGSQEVLEEITVTGSRIRASGMNTPTPVTAVDLDTLNRMEPGNIIDAISQLPQFFNNESPVTAGSTVSTPMGASSANLRGLGVNRTLTLLDGRRVAPYNLFGTVDIHTLPQALVQRLEVVTGGASASYGSDAVAGVINFILDKEFTGFESRVQRGVSSRGDGGNSEASLALGLPLGTRAHLLLSADYYGAEEISAQGLGERDWYRGWGLVTVPGRRPRQYVAPNVVSNDTTCGGYIHAPGTALHGLQFLEDGSTSRFATSALNGSVSQSIDAAYGGGSGCNPATFTDDGVSLVPKVSRHSYFAYADYDAADNLTLYGQFIRSSSETHLAGDNGILRGPWALTIFRDNAFLPAAVRDAMDEAGLESFTLNRVSTPRDIKRGRAEQSNDLHAIALGFDAGITAEGMFEGWNLNGHLQYGQSRNRIAHINFSRTDRIPQAVDAVLDPASGDIECFAASRYPERYGDCVPLDLFGPGRASQEAIDYVLGPTRTTVSDASQLFAEFAANGELFAGWGAGPVSMAAGLTYREEKLEQVIAYLDEADPFALVALDTPGNDAALGLRGVPPGFAGDPEILKFASIGPFVGGRLNVDEAFLEVIVPLLADRRLAEQVNFNGALRYADYSGSGGVESWKAGLDWQLTDELRLRATLSRDIRAGTMSERFNSRGANCGGIEDPALSGQVIDCSTTTGGNPRVAPEQADTVTAGFVYQPDWQPDLALSIDWYDVQLKGSIGQLGPQRIVDGCHAGAAELCGLVIRNSEGFITRIFDVFININEERVKGADLELSFSRPVRLLGGGNETLSLRLFTAWLEERSVTNLGAPKEDLTGEIGDRAFPEWKHTGQLSWRKGLVTLFLQGRYIDGGRRDNQAIEGVDIDDNSVASVFYTDLSLRYAVDSRASWEIFATVNNLADQAPPVAASFSTVLGGPGLGIPGSSMYDRVGRRYTLGLRLQF